MHREAHNDALVIFLLITFYGLAYLWCHMVTVCCVTSHCIIHADCSQFWKWLHGWSLFFNISTTLEMLLSTCIGAGPWVNMVQDCCINLQGAALLYLAMHQSCQNRLHYIILLSFKLSSTTAWQCHLGIIRCSLAPTENLRSSDLSRPSISLVCFVHCKKKLINWLIDCLVCVSFCSTNADVIGFCILHISGRC